MTVDTLLEPSATRLPLSASTISRKRRATNTAATTCMWVGVLAAIVPLAFLMAYVARKGAAMLSWRFFTAPIPVVGSRVGPGMGPAVLGTLLVTGAATLLAVPLGILAAIYVVEYGATNRLAGIIRFLSDVMAGIPSIVMGLFVYTVWVLRFKGNGQTAFAGSIALACLMLPIVIRSTEGMLRLVPGDLREAACALGCSKSRTVLTVVLPAAAAGITSGCLLAVARAAGETAPLLFTVGASHRVNRSLFHGANTTLSLQIFNNATSIFEPARDRAWGAALTLILLVLALTVIARVVASRLTVR